LFGVESKRAERQPISLGYATEAFCTVLPAWKPESALAGVEY